MLLVTDSRHLNYKKRLSYTYLVLDRKRVRACSKEIRRNVFHIVSFSYLQDSGKSHAQLSLILQTAFGLHATFRFFFAYTSEMQEIFASLQEIYFKLGQMSWML
jgi:hypothetical protein